MLIKNKMYNPDINKYIFTLKLTYNEFIKKYNPSALPTPLFVIIDINIINRPKIIDLLISYRFIVPLNTKLNANKKIPIKKYIIKRFILTLFCFISIIETNTKKTINTISLIIITFIAVFPFTNFTNSQIIFFYILF